MSILQQCYRILPIALLVLVFAASIAPAKAQGIEGWKCGGPFSCSEYRDDCPITLTSNIEIGAGTVRLDGLPEQTTSFYIDGIDRRWDWCLKDGLYSCSFIVSPDGQGRYLKFLGGESSAKPRNIYFCKKL